MDKKTYIAKIKENLADCSDEEVGEIIDQMEEHFSVGLEMGKTEEEIIEKLGDPNKITKEVKAYNYISKAEEKVTFKNVLRAIIAGLGMGFFNIVFVIGPYVLISMALVAVALISIGMILFGFGGTFFSAFMSYLPGVHVDFSHWSYVFYCASVGFAGITSTIFSYYIIKYFIILTLKYLKLNLGIITNKDL